MTYYVKSFKKIYEFMGGEIYKHIGLKLKNNFINFTVGGTNTLKYGYGYGFRPRYGISRFLHTSSVQVPNFQNLCIYVTYLYF